MAGCFLKTAFQWNDLKALTGVTSPRLYGHSEDIKQMDAWNLSEVRVNLCRGRSRKFQPPPCSPHTETRHGDYDYHGYRGRGRGKTPWWGSEPKRRTWDARYWSKTARKSCTYQKPQTVHLIDCMEETELLGDHNFYKDQMNGERPGPGPGNFWPRGRGRGRGRARARGRGFYHQGFTEKQYPPADYQEYEHSNTHSYTSRGTRFRDDRGYDEGDPRGYDPREREPEDLRNKISPKKRSVSPPQREKERARNKNYDRRYDYNERSRRSSPLRGLNHSRSPRPRQRSRSPRRRRSSSPEKRRHSQRDRNDEPSRSKKPRLSNFSKSPDRRDIKRENERDIKRENERRNNRRRSRSRSRNGRSTSTASYSSVSSSSESKSDSDRASSKASDSQKSSKVERKSSRKSPSEAKLEKRPRERYSQSRASGFRSKFEKNLANDSETENRTPSPLYNKRKTHPYQGINAWKKGFSPSRYKWTNPEIQKNEQTSTREVEIVYDYEDDEENVEDIESYLAELEKELEGNNDPDENDNEEIQKTEVIVSFGSDDQKIDNANIVAHETDHSNLDSEPVKENNRMSVNDQTKDQPNSIAQETDCNNIDSEPVNGNEALLDSVRKGLEYLKNVEETQKMQQKEEEFCTGKEGGRETTNQNDVSSRNNEQSSETKSENDGYTSEQTFIKEDQSSSCEQMDTYPLNESETPKQNELEEATSISTQKEKVLENTDFQSSSVEKNGKLPMNEYNKGIKTLEERVPKSEFNTYVLGKLGTLETWMEKKQKGKEMSNHLKSTVSENPSNEPEGKKCSASNSEKRVEAPYIVKEKAILKESGGKSGSIQKSNNECSIPVSEEIHQSTDGKDFVKQMPSTSERRPKDLPNKINKESESKRDNAAASSTQKSTRTSKEKNTQSEDLDLDKVSQIRKRRMSAPVPENKINLPCHKVSAEDPLGMKRIKNTNSKLTNANNDVELKSSDESSLMNNFESGKKESSVRGRENMWKNAQFIPLGAKHTPNRSVSKEPESKEMRQNQETGTPISIVKESSGMAPSKLKSLKKSSLARKQPYVKDTSNFAKRKERKAEMPITNSSKEKSKPRLNESSKNEVHSSDKDLELLKTKNSREESVTNKSKTDAHNQKVEKNILPHKNDNDRKGVENKKLLEAEHGSKSIGETATLPKGNINSAIHNLPACLPMYQSKKQRRLSGYSSNSMKKMDSDEQSKSSRKEVRETDQADTCKQTGHLTEKMNETEQSKSSNIIAEKTDRKDQSNSKSSKYETKKTAETGISNSSKHETKDKHVTSNSYKNEDKKVKHASKLQFHSNEGQSRSSKLKTIDPKVSKPKKSDANKKMLIVNLSKQNSSETSNTDFDSHKTFEPKVSKPKTNEADKNIVIPNLSNQSISETRNTDCDSQKLNEPTDYKTKTYKANKKTDMTNLSKPSTCETRNTDRDSQKVNESKVSKPKTNEGNKELNMVNLSKQSSSETRNTDRDSQKVNAPKVSKPKTSEANKELNMVNMSKQSSSETRNTDSDSQKVNEPKVSKPKTNEGNKEINIVNQSKQGTSETRNTNCDSQKVNESKVSKPKISEANKELSMINQSKQSSNETRNTDHDSQKVNEPKVSKPKTNEGHKELNMVNLSKQGSSETRNTDSDTQKVNEPKVSKPKTIEDNKDINMVNLSKQSSSETRNTDRDSQKVKEQYNSKPKINEGNKEMNMAKQSKQSIIETRNADHDSQKVNEPNGSKPTTNEAIKKTNVTNQSKQSTRDLTENTVGSEQSKCTKRNKNLFETFSKAVNERWLKVKGDSGDVKKTTNDASEAEKRSNQHVNEHMGKDIELKGTLIETDKNILKEKEIVEKGQKLNAVRTETKKDGAIVKMVEKANKDQNRNKAIDNNFSQERETGEEASEETVEDAKLDFSSQSSDINDVDDSIVENESHETDKSMTMNDTAIVTPVMVEKDYDYSLDAMNREDIDDDDIEYIDVNTPASPADHVDGHAKDSTESVEEKSIEESTEAVEQTVNSKKGIISEPEYPMSPEYQPMTPAPPGLRKAAPHIPLIHKVFDQQVLQNKGPGPVSINQKSDSDHLNASLNQQKEASNSDHADEESFQDTTCLSPSHTSCQFISHYCDDELYVESENKENEREVQIQTPGKTRKIIERTPHKRFGLRLENASKQLEEDEDQNNCSKKKEENVDHEKDENSQNPDIMNEANDSLEHDNSKEGEGLPKDETNKDSNLEKDSNFNRREWLMKARKNVKTPKKPKAHSSKEIANTSQDLAHIDEDNAESQTLAEVSESEATHSNDDKKKSDVVTVIPDKDLLNTSIFQKGFEVCHNKVLKSDLYPVTTFASLNPKKLYYGYGRCLKCLTCSSYFTPLTFTVHHDDQKVLKDLDQTRSMANGFTSKDGGIELMNQSAAAILEDFQKYFHAERSKKKIVQQKPPDSLLKEKNNNRIIASSPSSERGSDDAAGKDKPGQDVSPELTALLAESGETQSTYSENNDKVSNKSAERPEPNIEAISDDEEMPLLQREGPDEGLDRPSVGQLRKARSNSGPALPYPAQRLNMGQRARRSLELMQELVEDPEMVKRGQNVPHRMPPPYPQHPIPGPAFGRQGFQTGLPVNQGLHHHVEYQPVSCNVSQPGFVPANTAIGINLGSQSYGQLHPATMNAQYVPNLPQPGMQIPPLPATIPEISPQCMQSDPRPAPSQCMSGPVTFSQPCMTMPNQGQTFTGPITVPTRSVDSSRHQPMYTGLASALIDQDRVSRPPCMQQPPIIPDQSRARHHSASHQIMRVPEPITHIPGPSSGLQDRLYCPEPGPTVQGPVPIHHIRRGGQQPQVNPRTSTAEMYWRPPEQQRSQNPDQLHQNEVQMAAGIRDDQSGNPQQHLDSQLLKMASEHFNIHCEDDGVKLLLMSQLIQLRGYQLMGEDVKKNLQKKNQNKR